MALRCQFASHHHLQFVQYHKPFLSNRHLLPTIAPFTGNEQNFQSLLQFNFSINPSRFETNCHHHHTHQPQIFQIGLGKKTVFLKKSNRTEPSIWFSFNLKKSKYIIYKKTKISIRYSVHSTEPKN